MIVEDNLLVQKLKNGDKEAFDSLYEEYKNVALRTAFLIVNNQTDSEDIVQEAFIKVYLHIRELKNEDGFRPWLFQIVTRTAWNMGKKKSKEVPDEDILLKVDKSGRMNILDDLIISEQSLLIRDIINKLDIKYRTVVVLYYYNQFSTREIAKITECLEGTVKSRLFGARKMIKNALGTMEQEEFSYEELRTINQTNIM